MKRLFYALVIVVFITPAMAGVTLTCEDIGLNDANYPGVVEIRYEVDPPSDLVRFFALDIQADDSNAVIALDLDSLNPDYWIYPDKLKIEGNKIIDTNNPVVTGEEALSGPSGMTIVMASMYSGQENAPAPQGLLCKITVDRPCKLTVSGNESRGGIVFESGTASEVNATTKVVSSTATAPAAPTCWDIDECAGQPYGDANCDGSVNFADLIALRNAWGSSTGEPNYNCCVDLNHDGSIDFGELFKLKAGWGITSYTPSTGNTNCPP